MAIVLTHVEPIDHRDSRAIVCERGCLGASGEIRSVRMPVFPADDEARGTRLRDLRVKLGLGLREAARALWISAANLSAIERGEMRPTWNADDADEERLVPGTEAEAEQAIERAYRVASATKGPRTKAAVA